jgi:hypothetical protein
MGAFFCPTSSDCREPFSGNRRYNEVCHFTSHNSYAASENGYLYAQQQMCIEKQLNYGVRGLMLDIGKENDDIVLIHKNSFLTRLICRGKTPMPFQNALETIRNFLEKNPSEVLTIFLENYANDPVLVDTSFFKAGLSSYVLSPHDLNPAKQEWPTFEWMRTHNKRLIIFNATGETNYCFDEWRHVVENQWGTLHPVRACKERPESKAYQGKHRSLYLLNYFPFFKVHIGFGYEQINTEGLATFLKRVLSHGLDSKSNPSTLPTFLCIDFVEIGNGKKFVEYINSQWHIKRKSRL